MRTPRSHARREAGMSLVEVLVALVILSVGVLAVARMFPAGTRAMANDYSQEKIEQLTGKTWSDSTLTVGRHPAGTATESLGSGRWHRFYTVTAMNAPLDNLKRVDVTVTFSGAGKSTASSVVATTYVRR